MAAKHANWPVSAGTMTSSPGVARRAWVSRTLMRSEDREVMSAAVCQGPAARASMDKKTSKKNRHSESAEGGGQQKASPPPPWGRVAGTGAQPVSSPHPTHRMQRGWGQQKATPPPPGGALQAQVHSWCHPPIQPTACRGGGGQKASPPPLGVPGTCPGGPMG